jgi:hypothetical protein
VKRAARTFALAFVVLFGCAWACTNDYDEFAYAPADTEPGNTGPGSSGPGGPGGPSATGAGGSGSSGATTASAGGAP